MFRVLFVATALVARPLANPDVLEPSVQNEVDHALSLVPERPAETNRAILAVQREFAHLYATNGLDATGRAISLVSSQRDGEWHWRGTNVTATAVRLLQELVGDQSDRGQAPISAGDRPRSRLGTIWPGTDLGRGQTPIWPGTDPNLTGDRPRSLRP